MNRWGDAAIVTTMFLPLAPFFLFSLCAVYAARSGLWDTHQPLESCRPDAIQGDGGRVSLCLIERVLVGCLCD